MKVVEWQGFAYRDGLHDVPPEVGLEGQAVHGVPVGQQHAEAAHGHASRALVRDLVALFLQLCHARYLLGHLAQPHAEVVGAVVEARHTDADVLGRALDLHGKLLPARRVADEVADLGAARPADEFALSALGRGRLVALARVGFHTALAVPAAQLGCLVGRLAVCGCQLARPLRLTVEAEFVDLVEVFLALLLVEGFAAFAHGRLLRLGRLQAVLHGVFSTEVHVGYALAAILVFDGGEFGLDEALEVGEWLLGVDEQGEGLDVFAVAVHVFGGEGEDEFKHAGGGRKQFSYASS